MGKETKRSKKECKTSKNMPYEKNFYLYCIDYIKKHEKLPKNTLSKQALNYYVKQLKDASIIYRVGYNKWLVDQDKYEQYLFRKQVKITPKDTHPTAIEKLSQKQNIRGHGFVFTLKVKNIHNWTKRQIYLDKHGIDYKLIGLYKTTQSILFRNHKIWLSDHSVVVYFPKDKSFFDESAKDSKQYAIYNFEHIIKGLERFLSIDFKIMGKYQFKVSKQHYANINNSLANQYNKDGKKLNVSNKDGTWFIIDNSFNLDEAETINPKTADKDMDNVVMPFFNDLKDHYQKTGESMTMGKMLEIINGLIELNTKSELNKYNDNHDNHDKLKKPDYFG